MITSMWSNGWYDIKAQRYLFDSFAKRKEILIDNASSDFMRQHYQESPTYDTVGESMSIIDALVWLSYKDEEKKRILDNELVTMHPLSACL